MNLDHNDQTRHWSKIENEYVLRESVSKIEQDDGLSLPRISYCQIIIQEAGDCFDISNIFKNLFCEC